MESSIKSKICFEYNYASLVALVLILVLLFCWSNSNISQESEKRSKRDTKIEATVHNDNTTRKSNGAFNSTSQKRQNSININDKASVITIGTTIGASVLLLALLTSVIGWLLYRRENQMKQNQRKLENGPKLIAKHDILPDKYQDEVDYTEEIETSGEKISQNGYPMVVIDDAAQIAKEKENESYELCYKNTNSEHQLTIPRCQEGSVASRVKVIESLSPEGQEKSDSYTQPNVQYGSYLRLLDDHPKTDMDSVFQGGKILSEPEVDLTDEGTTIKTTKVANCDSTENKKKKLSVTFDENPVTIPSYDCEIPDDVKNN